MLKGGISPTVRTWVCRIRNPRIAHLPIRRVTPISRRFGLDRGEPIDRHYIEKFLAENSRCVRGACLEVSNDHYTRRFGGDQVTRADVLDVNPANAKANVRGDLRNLHQVADDTYDCIILTQVLQYIDDPRAALAETYRILKPGGTLLLTVPALGRCDDCHVTDYWRFTPNAVRHLLRGHFAPDNTEVRGHGNVLTGVAFWMGLAQADLRRRHLDYCDPDYPCVVAARAVK